MICPACASTHFQPTQIEGGLPAEQCEACRGVLVDLERYRTWRKTMPPLALAAASAEPSVTDGAVRLCPKTGRVMARLKVDSHHPLRLDYSAAAQAIWLDAGEWDTLMSLDVHGQLDGIASDRWQASVQRPPRANAWSKPCRRASATTWPSWPACGPGWTPARTGARCWPSWAHRKTDAKKHETMSQEQAAPEGAEASLRHSSSFDLLRKRLAEQGQSLLDKASALNQARLAEFGREEMALRARTRVRTENNCTARDLVLVGEVLLFGYNVFIGLRQETQVADVFALYRLRQDGAEVELEPLALDGSFLAEPRFVAEFKELYNYYRSAQLVQLRVTQGKLLAAFKIGERQSDLRVFRWQLDEQGAATYIDNRGERDVALPPPHDFEWTLTTREQHVLGAHPHVNVLDTLFVETVGGDLTVKIENNTETGLGIYSEPVDDPNQSLSDAEIAYASLGDLILLRVRPYRETQLRYLVYSRLSQQAQRVDSIGASCVQLPEDHGIVFPGGVILQGGESRLFSGLLDGLQFERRLLAPNGEDVLYVFYEVVSGTYVLLTYNLINKTLSQPLVAHGYARHDDGSMLLFTAESEEPTRNHPMQWWQTPFLSEEYAARAAPRQGFFGKIGNRELVRGVSELYSIARMVREQGAAGGDALPGRAVYESLLRQCRRVADAFHWLGAPEAKGVGADLGAVSEVAGATLDEFDKAAAIQREAARVLQQAAQEQRQLLAQTASRLWQSPTEFIEALEQIRLARGRLATLKERRYMDVARLAELDSELGAEEARVGERTVQFLAQANAFARLDADLAQQREQLPQLGTTAELAPLNEALDRTARNLDGLNELLGTLAVGDATLRTQILTAISRLYAGVNQLRAEVRQRRKQLAQTESASNSRPSSSCSASRWKAAWSRATHRSAATNC